MASERETALLRQILERPDDLAARAVYGDELQLRGDPRGELIALELAGARVEAAAARRAHAATWWPELARLPFATRNGFVERIHAPATRLGELQPLFAREPVRELELGGGAIAAALPATLVRLAVTGDGGGLASIERARIERLELTQITHDGLRDALALDWPAVHTLRVTGRGLPAAWRATVRDARSRLPGLARLELHGITLDDRALSAVRAMVPGVEVEASLGNGPFALDLASGTLELSRVRGELWSVEVDGTPSRVRWRRVLERTGHVMEPWQIADEAPLGQLASAIADNAGRALERDELELRLPTITQTLDALGVMTYQAYDTLWEMVETARISHDPAVRELTVTFLERHVRPDVDEVDPRFE
ncbi:MAG TPA: TIGR02996 domain-containing protein [Kofleriaceae bacterium]|nr:TIGR02996 domain-containing protein [Kofleriaceae bacterium]